LTDDDGLRHRAAELGVETSYWDVAGQLHHAPTETLRAVVDVLEADGPLDHRDVFLSEDEQALGTKLCACVSRAAGGAVTVDTGFRPDP
jgi:hypothetical protein